MVHAVENKESRVCLSVLKNALLDYYWRIYSEDKEERADPGPINPGHPIHSAVILVEETIGWQNYKQNWCLPHEALTFSGASGATINLDLLCGENHKAVLITHGMDLPSVGQAIAELFESVGCEVDSDLGYFQVTIPGDDELHAKVERLTSVVIEVSRKERGDTYQSGYSAGEKERLLLRKEIAKLETTLASSISEADISEINIEYSTEIERLKERRASEHKEYLKNLGRNGAEIEQLREQIAEMISNGRERSKDLVALNGRLAVADTENDRQSRVNAKLKKKILHRDEKPREFEKFGLRYELAAERKDLAELRTSLAPFVALTAAVLKKKPGSMSACYHRHGSAIVSFDDLKALL